MISLDPNAGQPLYTQIYEALRADIKSQALPAGSKLVPIRRLAQDLHVSRNTVETAYTQLALEGYVKARSGSGYIVNDMHFSTMLEAHEAAKRRQELLHDRLHDENRFADEPFNAPREAPFDFTYGDRPKNSFPAKIWRTLTNEALFAAENKTSCYGDGLGEPELRREIAKRIKATRGVHCIAEQIVIQPGTQAALTNLLALFDPAHDSIALEEPGYNGARAVFENLGFDITPVPVQDEAGTPSGRTGGFSEALEQSGAKLVFCTPSNQFPTGDIMPLCMRLSTIAWAQEHDGYILEDDYCREFRYDSRPIPSLQSLDDHERVVYMGTFSKVLSPALRISYLVLPFPLLRRWRKAYANYYCPVPWLSQYTLYLFMREKHLDRYARAAAADYGKKCNLLTESLQREMGGRIEILGGSAGLHLLVRTLDGRGQDELIRTAAAKGVRVYGTRDYWMNPSIANHEYVLIGFSSIEEAHIAEGVRRLAKAWFPA